MRFVVKPGEEEVWGRTYSDVVDHMISSKLEPVSTHARYRRLVAQRVLAIHGLEIDTEDDKAFVKSLEVRGLLERK